MIVNWGKGHQYFHPALLFTWGIRGATPDRSAEDVVFPVDLLLQASVVVTGDKVAEGQLAPIRK
jgi:hypothetical protein